MSGSNTRVIEWGCTTDEITRYEASRANASEHITKLKDLEMALSKQGTKFVEFMSSTAEALEESSEMRDEDMIEESGGESGDDSSDDWGEDDLGMRSEKAQPDLAALRLTRTGILAEIEAVVDKLHSGLRNMTEELQTSAKDTDLAVPETKSIDIFVIPTDYIFDDKGVGYGAVSTRKAHAQLNFVKSKVMELYCGVLKEWMELLTATGSAIKALEQRCEAEEPGIATRPRTVGPLAVDPRKEVVSLAREVLAGYTALRTSYEAAFSTAVVVLPSTFAYRTWQ
ncbi:hypothetical protein LTR10_003386 [Elasticomyces elasticus]|nr:hypothetical protein LTR10_003386 [Elasticomyces elasticus]KAK4969654.1 hypothetical protein LTR42_008926 [Elasticomyces elasticus]